MKGFLSRISFVCLRVLRGLGFQIELLRNLMTIRNRLAGALCLFVLSLISALAQDSNPLHHQEHAGNSSASQQDTSMAGMHMEEAETSQLPSLHAGSGTGWQPSSVPANEWMWMQGGWEWMAHGVVFMDYSQQGGPRGAGKAESVNWGMLMEQHRLGAGTILFRQMFSAESLTSPHPGFPELFQTGETYHSEPLVDHQHPHNVFAELSLLYTLPLTKKLSSRHRCSFRSPSAVA